ncbi:MAG: DUF5684 domain-containing protein [Nitrospirota bacterium]
MMKKVVFIITVFLVLGITDILLAETNKEYDTAIQYYNTGKYKEAINLLKIYIAKRPEPSAYYRIGYALYKLKQFNEANKYFEMTYLIEPTFSPQLAGLPELPEKMKKAAKPIRKAPLKQVPSAEKEAEQPGIKPEPMSENQLSKEVQPPKTHMPAVTPKVKPSLPEPQKVEPPSPPAPITLPSPPAEFPPPPMGEMPSPFPGVMPGLFTGFGIILILIEIAFYIFFSLCLFLIAKKLDVPAPWTAWIPIVQIWTIVASAGKPWWWILLLLVPIVNIVIGIYLWVLITENLGRNKWLGLLMLVPIINFVFLGILAFSKSEGGGYTPEATKA